jgi:hypothetical protein
LFQLTPCRAAIDGFRRNGNGGFEIRGAFRNQQSRRGIGYHDIALRTLPTFKDRADDGSVRLNVAAAQIL